MAMMLEFPEADILEQLRLVAGWVNIDKRSAPEMRVFQAAADEIERLRNRLGRISRLAHGAEASNEAA